MAGMQSAQDAKEAAGAFHAALRSPSPPCRKLRWARPQTSSLSRNSPADSTRSRPVMRRGEIACPAGGQDPEHVLCRGHGTTQQQQPRNLKVGDIREPRKKAAVLCGQGVKLHGYVLGRAEWGSEHAEATFRCRKARITNPDLRTFGR